jgi:hypothetical protein
MGEAEWKCNPACGFLLQEATIHGKRMMSCAAHSSTASGSGASSATWATTGLWEQQRRLSGALKIGCSAQKASL